MNTGHSRPTGPPVRSELLTLVAGGPAEPGWGDDESLIGDAERTHLLPTLDTALEDLTTDLSPTALRSLALRRLGARHVRLVYEETLTRVVGTLEEAGIDFLILKGIVNEALWYRPLERRMSDIDIVVHPHHLPQIPAIVAELAPDDPHADRAVQALVSRGIDAVDLDCGGCSVDLHSAVFKALVPARDESDAWRRAISVEAIDGVTVQALDPELALVHATTHTLIDRFCFLSGPADIARMLSADDLDWGRIGTFLASEGWADSVAFGLWRVADLASLPAGRIGLPRPRDRRLHDLIWPRELIGAGREAWHRTIPRSKLIPLTYRGRWRDITRDLARNAVPSDAYLAYRFTDLAPTRPGRIIQWQRTWLSKYVPGLSPREQ